MGLQGRELAAVGLGLLQDTPGTPEQPPLPTGIHVRWGTTAARAFPWYGFYVYRRAGLPGVPEQFDVASLGTVPGTLGATTLATAQGSFGSDTALVLTDTEPPAGGLEFDLAGRGFLRFDRPVGADIRLARARVAFRRQPDEPEPVSDEVDFSHRRPGAGPNPRVERGVVFLALDGDGDGTPAARSHIRRFRFAQQWYGGLDGEHGLDITLKLPASHVELTLTRFPPDGGEHDGPEHEHDHDGHGHGHDHDGHGHGHHHGESGVAIIAIERDGTTTTTTLGPARHPLTGTTQLLGRAIERIRIRPFGRHAPGLLLAALGYGTARISRLGLTALYQSVPVAHAELVGYAGLTVTGSVEFDAFTALRLEPAAAALVDLSWVPVEQDTTSGWEPVPGLAAPLRLPVSHPGYPCTPAAAPSLSAARELARGRIRYGDPDGYTAVPGAVAGAGTVTVTTGSPIVTGAGTGWTAMIAGTLLAVPGQDDAYGIARVIDTGRLALTRPYGGPSRTGTPYTLADDPFAHLHDQLMVLVADGPAGGAMARRTLPVPVERAGTVAVTHGEPAVTGTGTAWGPLLRGLTFSVTEGNAAEGDAAEGDGYTIIDVPAPTELTLDRPYAGVDAAGLGYTITAPLQAADDGAGAPGVPGLCPLDLVLLAGTDPAVAQMLGLYALDASAETGQDYDYLVVADHTGIGALDAATLLAAIRAGGFANVDAYLVHHLRLGTPQPVAAPDGPRLYALPGTNRVDGPAGTDTSNAVGLRWDLRRTEQDVLVPGGPIGYHVWRAELGDAAEPAGPGTYQILTRGRPVLPSEQPVTVPAPDRPPYPMHAIDAALPEGWYGYRLSGVDVFGRHSPLGEPGSWWQWAPAPRPRPWYYQDPPGDRQLRAGAIRLLVGTAPPAPPGVQAWALDPADPLITQDAAYQAWWDALRAAPWYLDLPEPQRRDLIGVRIRWRWTPAEQAQAPATRQFRVYVRPGTPNTLFGTVTSAVPGDPGETLVATDIAHTAPAGAFAGALLRIGSDEFPILDSGAQSPLTLRVRDIGVERETAPVAASACAVVLPRAYTEGTIELSPGSDIVTGHRTGWVTAFTGTPLRIPGLVEAYPTEPYRVAEVLAPDRLRLDRPYSGDAASDQRYALDHPLWTDLTRAAGWQDRVSIVDIDEHWTVVPDQPGVRQYELFLPDPSGEVPTGTVPTGLPLHPSLADPIAYARVGVSAADEAPYTPDDPRWDAGHWGGRPGNEGPVGAPATVFRIWREVPPRPVAVPGPTPVTAVRAGTAATAHHTYRWFACPPLRLHVLRALDDTVCRADWPSRPRDPLLASRLDYFPDETLEPDWDAARREAVAAELNHLNTFDPDTPDGTAGAMAWYRSLSDDALRVLAGLPGNEPALHSLTSSPLDPADPGTADRPEPDDPADYVPRPDARVYLDAVDGLAAGRFVYTGVHVDTAGNVGLPGVPAAVVHVPSALPPGTPRPRVAGLGDGAVTLQWPAGREPDLLEYRLFRADGAAPDTGAAALIRRIPAGDPDLAARPPTVTVTDDGLPGGRTYTYTVVAASRSELVSNPSPPVVAVVVDTRPPSAPVWRDLCWVALHADGTDEPWPGGGALPEGTTPAIRLTWSTGSTDDDTGDGTGDQTPTTGNGTAVTVTIARRARQDAAWVPVVVDETPAPLPDGRYRHYDANVSPERTYAYRITATSPAGLVSVRPRVTEIGYP